ncbi:MAG: aspartate carbamoyltransferase, partial [Acidimicrobiia bacterium]|nr:aspartate carbamoyltransferase [Acidimicrobiia bacterium]
AHSRVARSNVAAFTKMGASVTLVAPHTLLPPAVDTWPVRVSGDLDSVLADTDVVYLLRMQLERQNSAFVPSLTEYANRFGLSEKRAELLHSKAVIMHPGPMNRGVEIADVVANMAEPIVTQQVTSGVAVRMAVLHHVLGGSAT